MKQKQPNTTKGRAAKSVLRLLDLEVAKSAVLSSLSSTDAQRGYRHAIDEFADWYCSEPRLAWSPSCGKAGEQGGAQESPSLQDLTEPLRPRPRDSRDGWETKLLDEPHVQIGDPFC